MKKAGASQDAPAFFASVEVASSNQDFFALFFTTFFCPLDFFRCGGLLAAGAARCFRLDLASVRLALELLRRGRGALDARLQRRNRVVPAEREHLLTDIAASEFQRRRVAAVAVDAESVDSDDIVDLHTLLALVERVAPWRDCRVAAVECVRREVDAVERRRRAGDEAAVRRTIGGERIGMHFVDEFVDQFGALVEQVGECRCRKRKRQARNTGCQLAERPENPERRRRAVHLVIGEERMRHRARIDAR
ncbi:hypothetical protein CSX04_03423 [Burkholderia cepacia]|nr:hypothetical protein CSX04_03423 [Burkholderia cepacia]